MMEIQYICNGKVMVDGGQCTSVSGGLIIVIAYVGCSRNTRISGTPLVIVHQSLVTTSPTLETGRQIAWQMCCVFTFALSPRCRTNAGDLCFRQNSSAI